MSTTTQKAPVGRPTRFSSCLPAVLHEIGDYPCHATNVSRSGVQLFGDLPVPSMDQVRVTLGSPAGDLTLRSVARVVRVVGGEVPGEVVVALEFAPLDPGRTEVLDKLLARLGENRAGGPLDRVDESAPEERQRAVVGGIAKSQKIALAQRAQFQERAKLFLDDDLEVLEGLARNPRLSKREIRALLDRTHLLPSTLSVLAAHPRVKGDEGLQVRLAAHASATLETAQAIANGLGIDGVRRLLREPHLNDRLRAYLLRESPEAASSSGW